MRQETAARMGLRIAFCARFLSARYCYIIRPIGRLLRLFWQPEMLAAEL